MKRNALHIPFLLVVPCCVAPIKQCVKYEPINIQHTATHVALKLHRIVPFIYPPNGTTRCDRIEISTLQIALVPPFFATSSTSRCSLPYRPAKTNRHHNISVDAVFFASKCLFDNRESRVNLARRHSKAKQNSA